MDWAIPTAQEKSPEESDSAGLDAFDSLSRLLLSDSRQDAEHSNSERGCKTVVHTE